MPAKRPTASSLVYFTDNSNGTIFDVRTVDPISNFSVQANKNNSHN
jgi:hypothetical protein